MGQYYKVVNTTKRQVMTPHKFDSGSKLMEFSSDGMGIMQALAILLSDGNNRGGGDLRSDNPIIGSWAGDEIVVAGDYGDEGKFCDNPTQNLYTNSKDYKDVSFDVIEALCEDSWWKQNYFNNWKQHNFQDYNEERQSFCVKMFGEQTNSKTNDYA